MINSFTGRWRFLSNFYPVTIEHQGIKYPSVEHYYVAMKIKNDQQIDGKYLSYIDCRELIAKMPDPAKVKQFGKMLKLRKDWDDVKLDVMLWGVREKFKNEELKDMILSTEGEELVESNWWGDKFWGVSNGEGENHLGKILMRVRDEVKKVDQKPSLEEFIKNIKK